MMASPAAVEPEVFEEEKKSQDTESLKEDIEELIWGDDPEKAYFRDMMNDKAGDESLLGNHTIDQIENGLEPPRTADEDASYMVDDPNAPLQLAVLGPQDDLSTIAGDTLAGNSVVTAGAVFSSANLPRTIQTSYKPTDQQVVQRDFKEYELETPKKSKKNRWIPYARRDDTDDEHTQPETPPGVIGVAKDDGESVDKDGESTWMSIVGPTKRMYACAGIFGAILLILIIGLGVAYGKIGDDDENSNGSTNGSRSQPGDSSGGFSPEELATLATDPPVETQPTIPIVLTPEMSALVDVLEKNGVPDPAALLVNEDSPQGQAMQWMAADPNFGDYTEDRLIQRYALATFANGLEAQDDVSGSQRALAEALPQWLDYDINECDWFSTEETDPVCNGFGLYERLVLTDLGLQGTIPEELSLLSNSLGIIDLRGNKFSGSIPSELGKLSLLRWLIAPTNYIAGELPTELGLLDQLQILSLARNELVGTLPSEIGKLQRLSRMILHTNQLNGSIPPEIGNLQSVVTMDLSGNDFTGDVPDLQNMTALTSLSLQMNELAGGLEGACELSLSTVEADCHLVSCPCCTFCADTMVPTGSPIIGLTSLPTRSSTPNPTDVPTVSPTASPTKEPTKSPTATPTLSPTPQPTSCTPNLDWETDCFDVGDEFEVRFRNCQPQFGDWIGIFDKDANPNNLPEPYLWVWACGTQSCRGSPRTGIIRFDETTVDAEAGRWPLERGDYHAYMIRNSGSPYSAFLETDKRKVRNDDC